MCSIRVVFGRHCLTHFMASAEYQNELKCFLEMIKSSNFSNNLGVTSQEFQMCGNFENVSPPSKILK